MTDGFNKIKKKVLSQRRILFLTEIVVPTPLVGGGTIYSNGFFCSDNSDRYIHRREM